MEELDRLTRLFREALAGNPWHGPSLGTVLEGIDAAAAGARPPERSHSIWEIVLHLTGWTREVASRLEGKDPEPPARGDWPEPGPLDEARWIAARADLFSAHEELITSLAGFAASRLSERIGVARDAPLGTGVSYREMILGALQHDAYHAGQISLLRKRSAYRA